MKRLYMIGGTMGVGKTAVCRELKTQLDNTVFLDGDWCWDSDPFQVTEETKTMVLQNISFLLNQFLHCSAYDNVLFCWVMHEQSIIDTILERLDIKGCEVKAVSLLCSEDTLRERLRKDISEGKRLPDVVDKSVSRIPLYRQLNTIKVETDGKTSREIADEIAGLPFQSNLKLLY